MADLGSGNNLFHILFPPIGQWLHIPTDYLIPLLGLLAVVIILLVIKSVNTVAKDFSAGLSIFAIGLVFVVLVVLIYTNIDSIKDFFIRLYNPIFHWVQR